MDTQSRDRSPGGLWSPSTKGWQECPAGAGSTWPGCCSDHWSLPPYAIGMLRCWPGTNPSPGGGWPGHGYSNATGPENHLAHLKTSLCPQLNSSSGAHERWAIRRIDWKSKGVHFLQGLLYDRSSPFGAGAFCSSVCFL